MSSVPVLRKQVRCSTWRGATALDLKPRCTRHWCKHKRAYGILNFQRWFRTLLHLPLGSVYLELRNGISTRCLACWKLLAGDTQQQSASSHDLLRPQPCNVDFGKNAWKATHSILSNAATPPNNPYNADLSVCRAHIMLHADEAWFASFNKRNNQHVFMPAALGLPFLIPTHHLALDSTTTNRPPITMFKHWLLCRLSCHVGAMLPGRRTHHRRLSACLLACLPT